MLHALVWFLVLALLALWSLTAWGVHALGAWTLTNAGALGGAAADAARAADAWLPAWMAPWLPPGFAEGLSALAVGLQPFTEFIVGLAPLVGGGLSLAVWLLWAFGALALVALGVVGSVAVVMWRRHRHAVPRRPDAVPTVIGQWQR